MRVLLFDIDGTLLLTGGAGFVALRRIFADLYGVEDAVRDIEFHGRTDPLILDSIAERHLGRRLSTDEARRVEERYVTELGPCLDSSEGFQVLPGVVGLLEALGTREDVVLGLATGNWERAAHAKLRRGSLDRWFDSNGALPAGYGSDAADRAELTRLAVQRARGIAGPDAEILVIGDTIHDVRASAAAGVPCLAVATGNATEAVLEAEGAAWTVPSLESPDVARILGL
ncbi:MAG: haloacid dehalogenase-like hydrolase [Gemmatimonadetes bacterium]|nr:haloacid dehalogenase-like hydrolase [Gemmatimonadota bacterium]